MRTEREVSPLIRLFGRYLRDIGLPVTSQREAVAAVVFDSEGHLSVDDIERELIRESISRHRGNISETARALGLTRRGLYLKLRRLGLEGPA